MSLMQAAIAHYREEFKRYQKEFPPHPHREAALKSFISHGFPTIQNEEWKYTKLHGFLESRFFYKKNDSLEFRPIHLIVDSYLKLKNKLVFIDGSYMVSLSSLSYLSSGVEVSSINKNAIQNDVVLDGMIAFNQAFFTDGAHVHVKKNILLEEPLHIIYINSQSDSLCVYRNLFKIDEGAHIQIMEHYISLDNNAHFTNTASEIIAKPNSHVTHIKLQKENENTYHVGRLKVHQQRDSEVKSHSFAFGGKLVRSDSHFVLEEKGANCELNGLYSISNKQHVDHHTCVEHRASHTQSQELYKGIIDKEARAVFNGKIIVHPKIHYVIASQKNNNLLLSKQSEVNSKPQLEIFSDDVQCHHGATVGQLDQNALYYLLSRGIEENVARHMLIYSFAKDLLDNITSSECKKIVNDNAVTQLF